jgi:Domain of unknown function (DUF4864)/zinc-ribbon domain
MFCSHCAAKVEPGYKYCPVCGARLDSSLREPSLIPNETVLGKKNPLPFWIKFASVIVSLALISAITGILFTETWMDVVNGQLKALRQKDIARAYYGYTSKEFQTATSLDQFRNFTKAYPVFFNNQSAHFIEYTMDQNSGTVKGNLIDNNQEITPIEYKLVREGKWKILSIHLLKPENIQTMLSLSDDQEKIAFENPEEKFLAPNPNMSFGTVLLGNQVDEHGQIKQPMTSFKSDLGDLFVNIDLKNGIKDRTVYLSLQHLESGSSLSAKSLIEENGDNMLVSIFSPPQSGWPKGHYKLVVTTSSGQSDIVDFEIGEKKSL